MTTEKSRCEWCTGSDIEIDYHDKEWGVPLHDDQRLFEFLILEGAQAGLSWITILKKRDNFRAGFDGFDPLLVAEYDEAKVAELLQDKGIIRHRGKIEATIGNARAYNEIEARMGFDTYLWNYVDGKPLQPGFLTQKDVPTETKLSQQISKDLKKEGFRFVGPTIVYAFMEAVGIVNDHITTCHRHHEVKGL